MSTRKKPKNGLIAIDLLILVGSYIVVAGLKPVMAAYLSPKYLIGFGIMLFIWMVSSFYFKKYHISRKEKPAPRLPVRPRASRRRRAEPWPFIGPSPARDGGS